jgi:hypothetical protein
MDDVDKCVEVRMQGNNGFKGRTQVFLREWTEDISHWEETEYKAKKPGDAGSPCWQPRVKRSDPEPNAELDPNGRR